jgi:hypothetical protein
MAVGFKRGPRLSREVRLTLPPSQQACVEAFERSLGIPFCGVDLEPLKEAIAGPGRRFVVRGIVECASSLFAFDAVREGMAVITRGVSRGWNVIQEMNASAARSPQTPGAGRSRSIPTRSWP